MIDVVGCPWLNSRWPPSHSITPPPQLDQGRKVQWNTCGSRWRRGDHLPITVMGKTDFNLLPIKSQQDNEK